ncbi:hypothetical protein RI367_005048 [Sorochytrium milnesiophthora]
MRNRRLGQPFAEGLSMWGFLVGIVISGVYFGWNAGLWVGWANMMAATTLIAITYWLLVLIHVDMMYTVPYSACTTIFVVKAFGRKAAFASDILHLVELILLTGSNVVALGDYLATAIGSPRPLIFVYWAVLLAAVAAGLSILIIVLFLAQLIYLRAAPSATTTANYATAFNLSGFIRCFPYSVWMFQGAESLSLLADEARGFRKLMPTVSVLCMLVLTVCFMGCVGLAPAIPAYAVFLNSPQPILDTILWYFNESFTSSMGKAMQLITIMIPLFVSLMCSYYATSRKLYTMSRAGLLPHAISITSKGLPELAIMCTGVICLLFQTPFELYSQIMTDGAGLPGSSVVGNTYTSNLLLRLGVFYAAITTVVQMSAFLQLRLKYRYPTRWNRAVMMACAIFVLTVFVIVVINSMIVRPLIYGPTVGITIVLLVPAAHYWNSVCDGNDEICPEFVCLRQYELGPTNISHISAISSPGKSKPLL